MGDSAVVGWLVMVQTPSKVLVVVIRSRITCSYVALERAETPVSLTSVLIDFCRYPGVTQGCGLFIPQPQFGVGKKMDAVAPQPVSWSQNAGVQREGWRWEKEAAVPA